MRLLYLIVEFAMLVSEAHGCFARHVATRNPNGRHCTPGWPFCGARNRLLPGRLARRLISASALSFPSFTCGATTRRFEPFTIAPCERSELVRRIAVLNGTTVRTRRGRFHRLTGHSRFECQTDVIRCSRNIAQVGRGLIVNGPVVDHDTLGVDDHHLRRRLCLVEAANLPGGVEQRGSRRSLHLGHIVILFARGRVPLLARRRRKNREPYDAARSPLLLQPLHVAAVVVLSHVWASIVVPLQDDILSAIVR